MKEGDTLLAAIMTDIDNDALRFVYADWLDENGRPDRAAFIRAQIRGEHDKAIAAFSPQAWTEEWAGSLEKVDTDQDFHIICQVGDEPVGCIWRRGFIDVVECRLAGWTTFGRRIVERHPVTRVVLVDKQPGDGYAGVQWKKARRQRQSVKSRDVAKPEYLPSVLFGLLTQGDDVIGSREYDEESFALDDLSNALIAWAKSRDLISGE